MSVPDTYLQLRGQLDEVRQRWRGRNLLTGTLLALAFVFVTIVAVVAIDNLVKPETFGRFLLAGLLWTVIAATLYRYVVQPLRQTRCDDFFGAMVERKHAELGNYLINALQLGRGDPYGSPQVVAAIVDDAARVTADVDVVDCLDSKQLKRAAIYAGVAGLFILAYAGALTPWFTNGLRRAVFPTAEIAPYTATRIISVSVEPGDTVPAGVDVSFQAEIAGHIPRQVILARKSSTDEKWLESSMNAEVTQKRTYQYSLEQVMDSFEYRIFAGDARSAISRITVIERPNVENIAVTHTPPAYTGLPSTTSDRSDGDLAGLPGASFELLLTASKPLKEARFLTAEGATEPVILDQEGDPAVWVGRFKLLGEKANSEPEPDVQGLEAPVRYQLRLADMNNYDNVNPLWRNISLTRDQIPSVSIIAPGRDLHAQVEETISLVIEAKDDYGLGEVKLLYRVNDETTPRQLARFPQGDVIERQTRHSYEWKLTESGLKPGDLVQYWAIVSDRNNITGPNEGESRRFSVFVLTPVVAIAQFEIQMNDFVHVLEELVRLQRENRAQTASGLPFDGLVTRQTLIRTTSHKLARTMEESPTSFDAMVETLDRLYLGLMADAIRLLEAGRDASDAAQAGKTRQDSLPVQDQIIEELKMMLERLQRNEQARNQLRKLARTDEPAYEQLSDVLTRMMEDLGRMAMDTQEFMGQFEKLPKKDKDEASGEALEKTEALDELTRKWGEWAKGSVDELTKLPSGFVDDFGLRPELERIYEEIEEVAQKPETVKMHVALEDLGAMLATEMLEDLEMWMMDTPDNLQWVMEAPLLDKPMEIPEMPLPDVLQDMVGDLLEEAYEIDQEAEDTTSAWGDSLNQAGWAVMDGPISNYSAKGVTGNVLPNDMELSGRAGDGRRGKSSGQMVSETTRNLEGRQTPARVSAERYEPGAIKALQSQDPAGATGGGKKAGAGEQGLQGGTPPDFVKDMDRLRTLHVGLREHATRVANQLELAGVQSRRLETGIELLKSLENDLRDLRYQDAARRRRTALSELRAVPYELDRSLAVQLSHARELPENLREDLLQGADEPYPEGYEGMLSTYYRTLAEAEGE